MPQEKRPRLPPHACPDYLADGLFIGVELFDDVAELALPAVEPALSMSANMIEARRWRNASANPECGFSTR